ncbi:MAG: PHP domain-containing protein [Nitrospinaceae bacterium]|nr:PHP domain-containing protein [Nitrospinaceae bacterium]NIR55208.1 PHP domain-containing protein [Nitrospinaceae bacterium]NIS85635.1 PHP domain-containing protein [Nitrospinaceae bacterium]NIT82480.1 PHP domain-containing protein [Nitrospinaceae bacterium]NIU44685.1 PHP domain-containing protein [Nitrospinaceae bacterium]
MAPLKSEIHMHSIFSDGEFSPAELIGIGRQNGVGIMALTDHDTFSGLPEFMEAARGSDVFAFCGIEITVQYRDFNLHLLAYFKSVESIRPELWVRVEKMKEAREDRMHQLIARINEVIPDRFRGSITFDNVKKASEGVLARPHLAREMVRLGIVKSTNDAFDRYLVKYNIEKENLEMAEALRMVRESNGVPVLAHPGERTYSLYNPDKGRKLEGVPEMVADLKSKGLLGLECIYPHHEKMGKVDYFLSLAEEFDLVATGSRDFHGFTTYQTPDILGTTKMDDAFLARFQEIWNSSPEREC